MVAGTPRTVSPPPEELNALGIEMVEFIKKNKSSILHISEWYSIEKSFTYNQWKTFIQRPEFIPHYEKALIIIGKKYLDKDSNVRDSIAHRWQHNYFRDFKESEREEAKFKSDLAKDEKKEELKQIQLIQYGNQNNKPNTPV